MGATTPSLGLRARLREILALALLATLGCEIADFEVERQEIATIPRERAEEPFEMMELDGLEIVLGEVQDDHEVGREDISRAELVRITLTVIEPAAADLSFVDRIEVFAEAPDLPRVRVAHLDQTPRQSNDVELEIDDVDLRDYVASDRVTLVARIDGQAPAMDVRVRATVVLDIGVTVRGACDHGV
jgi:hypothetical protein